MISAATLDALRDRFGTASWAIWSDRFPRRDSVEASTDPDDLVSHITDRADELRPELVLVGLNPSGDRPGNFANFHSIAARHQDVWLRAFVEESELEGAYMTDLVDVSEPRAVNVTADDSTLKRFGSQLQLLDRESFTVIAFGRDAFRAVLSAGPGGFEDHDDGVLSADLRLEGMDIDLYGVYHYSQVDPDNVRRLRDQLGRLGPDILGP